MRHRNIGYWIRGGLLGTLFILLAACATRPGPDALNTVSSAPGAKLVKVYVATTRDRTSTDSNAFTADRALQLNYAEFTIAIPPGHKPGVIEWSAGTNDPARNFVVVGQEILDAGQFYNRVARQRGTRRPERIGVFVHGFNTNFQEAVFRLAQMAADADIDGLPILFAWPSEATVTGYIADRDAATYSRDGLVQLLTTLTRAYPRDEITLVGHSMGGWLTVEALRQLKLTGRVDVLNRLDVVLAAPDIDIDVFRSQMMVIGPLRQPITVLVASDDRALSLSGKLAGDRPRLGALDINDPRIQEAALKANLQFVDISKLTASDSLNHDRYVNLAQLYPSLAATAGNGAGNGLRRAGAFIFNAVGATLSSPFDLAGRALAPN
ncbi:alpha/beta fold hydrolase [Chelatococcus sp. YT9]|uniref:alpha/beta hydrolase n=1 Tax=Chelatococcus sp. YT9 TaxID=2835635 RepID=UPI001BCCF924|nr:alpha/beta fold hydrolase [Chelatococcus sp. YT9]MBS7701345.1 alpha/beta fold hydrolase [Chelatococcus sp. YT9]